MPAKKPRSSKVVKRWDWKDRRGSRVKTHTIYVKANGSVSLKTYDGFHQTQAFYHPKSVKAAKQLMKTYEGVPFKAWRLRK